jgi:Family of unknown function (DUF5709)
VDTHFSPHPDPEIILSRTGTGTRTRPPVTSSGSRPTTARDPRSGRLIAEDEEESYDDPDLVAYDSGIDGGGASAEEAAVHVVDEEPGEES